MNNVKSHIEKIQCLDLKALSDLLKKLLDRKGFSDVIIEEDCLKGELPSPLTSDTTSVIFVTFPHKLGGYNPEYEQISNQIKTLRDKYLADKVFVYSKEVITKGFQTSLTQYSSPIKISYIGRDELINLVDDVFPDFWRHDDIQLLSYEKGFMEFIANDNDLKKLKFPNDNYSKLLDIFIEPQLTRYYQDKKTNTPVFKRYSVQELIEYDGNVIIGGSAGAGKSTLLKRIGGKLIDLNSSTIGKKHYPIYLTSLDIFKANFSISNAIRAKLSDYTESSLTELSHEYDVQLLIDSIDEFDEKRSEILDEIHKICSQSSIKYYIASRNGEGLISPSIPALSSFSIRKFNLTQIKLFLDAFFSGDEGKSSTLLDALRNNQMIERLPMTPLTLSLISILFEETEFEIPATLSDVYDNFNTLIIGKAVVSTKIEFIDISFKERILSIYALKLLETENHIPLKRDEYIDFFKKYFEGKSLPVKKGTLEDVLDYLIQNTGILYLKDGDRVQFTHDSYMEYYAALEIFKHRRDMQQQLVANFFDPNWQNAAVFYAGESKDMPAFLQEINKKIQSGAKLYDLMSGIFGAGYILQALYQTDNQYRKDTIISALQLSIKCLHFFEMMAADDVVLFKDYKMPILSLINFIYFYESFNSITLAEPLRMAYKELYSIFKSKGCSDMAVGYNLLELAFTLDSKRIMDQTALQEVVDTPEILKDPNLSLLASISLELLGKEKYKDFITDIKRKLSSSKEVCKALIGTSVSKLRFSAFDTIHYQSNVKLLVEGKTDAAIIEYAYLVLSGGMLPYWNISKAGRNEEIGSCEQVKKTLEQAYALLDPDKIIIGLFDHDNAGLGSYRGLNTDFIELEKNTIKKHKDGNIYALCLPIPGEMEDYIKERQESNYFEIEHYFGYEYLRDAGVIKKTDIPGIYDITGNKINFVKKIRSETDPYIFEKFLVLFNQIDKITQEKVDYIL